MSQVFQYPGCKEFISSDADVCRFCKTPIDAETKRMGAMAQEKENRQYRRNQYLKHVGIDALLFIGGLVITVGSYAIASSGEGGGGFLITYGLMLSGGLDFLYGLVGYLGELRDK